MRLRYALTPLLLALTACGCAFGRGEPPAGGACDVEGAQCGESACIPIIYCDGPGGTNCQVYGYVSSTGYEATWSCRPDPESTTPCCTADVLCTSNQVYGQFDSTCTGAYTERQTFHPTCTYGVFVYDEDLEQWFVQCE